MLRGAHSTVAHNKIVVESPYSGEVVAEVPLSTAFEAGAVVAKASRAQLAWRSSSLAQRVAACQAFSSYVDKNSAKIAREISLQMGKPVSQAVNEINGMKHRTEALIGMAAQALETEHFPEAGGIQKRIVKEPVGVVLTIAPWNYPLLTAVNSIVPAVLAGNSVVLKMSPRTPLTAVSAFRDGFAVAGVPDGLVSTLDCTNDVAASVIANPNVGFVSFTGSVAGGRSVYQTVAGSRFIDATLELGGKDPAYVRSDADLSAAVATVVDGACYNAGQSCCAVERVYVHRSIYAQFLEAARAELTAYKLGDPLASDSGMGPLALPAAPAFLLGQVQEAVAKGARLLLGGAAVTDGVSSKARFFQPTLLAGADHTMSVMTEESFGPIVAVMPVDSDEQAVALMNDSVYGLTAAVFTKDLARFEAIAADMNSHRVPQQVRLSGP